jgi:hypothetical protein
MAWVSGTCPKRPPLVADRVQLCAHDTFDALGGPETLFNEEALHSVHRGNKEAAFYSGFVIPKEPSDGLEPSTPSLPWRIRGRTPGAGTMLGTSLCLHVR